MPPQQAISRTAQSVALARAIERSVPAVQRLFDDPYASGFLTRWRWRVAARLCERRLFGAALTRWRERSFPGSHAALVCRTRFIDDALRAALARGVRQVAILGAGFDARAYRLPEAARAEFFEVDQPATQAWKRARVSHLLGAEPRHVRFVAIDFERAALADALVLAGFRPGVLSFFIWEGVTQYVNAEAVEATLACVARLSAPGSELAFTYIRRSALANAAAPEAAAARRGGEPWVLGFEPDELAARLTAHGLTRIDEAGAAEHRARYLAPRARALHIEDYERCVLARVLELPSA